MDLSIPPALLLAASWLGAMSGVWLLFDRVEQVLSLDAKPAISHWLRNLRLPEDRTRGWVTPFLETVDRIFGYRLLSFRSALVSLSISLASVGIIALLSA